MATEELQPVAAENTVATPTSVAPAMNAEPLLPTLNASAVYAPSNVQQVLTKSSKTYKKMKLSKLEKQIAKAQSQAELNQINIENTPVAMGVISGQLSQQSKLDTARLNAVTGLYNAKLLDEQRKEAERQQFISTYGADPNQRPKGMSKREFAKAIQGGKFSNLLTEDFKQKQLQTLSAQQSLSGGSGGGTIAERSGEVLATSQNALLSSRGEDGKVDPNVYTTQRAEYMRAGGTAQDFDNQFAGLLSTQEQGNLGISSSSGGIDQWTELLSKGQATIANVPISIRDTVVQRVSELGTGVNKQLSDSALSEINQSKSALTGLDDLQSKIINNQNQLGPITGLEALNPWSEKRRLQADIDRVRQVVGKALEGGVLRKEDEEKYKKILATITDTPETALYKIEALKSDIQRKIDEYIELQAGAGKYTGGIQTGVDTENLRTKYNY
jgi:hypothetical protein